MIKSICILAVLAFIAALVAMDDTEPEDLGTLTPRTAVVLTHDSGRTDFLHFVVEVARGTNVLHTFTTTNLILFASNFTALPSGRLVLGLASVWVDGSQSAVKLYTIRWAPVSRPPSAHVVTVLDENEVRDNLPLAVGRSQSARSARAPAPPLPPGEVNKRGGFVPVRPAPLPSAEDIYRGQMTNFYQQKFQKRPPSQ